MTDTYSEAWRHECEVRWCLEHPFEWFEVYAKGVAKVRGKRAAERLWRDVKAAAKRREAA